MLRPHAMPRHVNVCAHQNKKQTSRMSSWMIWQTMRDHKCVKISKISHLNLFCRSQVIAEHQPYQTNYELQRLLYVSVLHWSTPQPPWFERWLDYLAFPLGAELEMSLVGKLQLRQRLGELGNTLALTRLSKPEYINSTWLYENMLPNPQLLVHNGSKGTCCDIIWTGWPFHVSRCQKGCRRHSAVTS